MRVPACVFAAATVWLLPSGFAHSLYAANPPRCSCWLPRMPMRRSCGRSSRMGPECLPTARRGGGKEGWTALTIAEGAFYAHTFKRSFETAALLRDLLEQRGLEWRVQ